MAKKKFKQKKEDDLKTQGVSMADLIAMADYLKEAKYKNDVANAVLAQFMANPQSPKELAKEAAFWVGYMEGTTALIETGTMLPSVGQLVQGWLHDEKRFTVLFRDEDGSWLERVPPQIRGMVDNVMDAPVRNVKYPETAVTYWFILPGAPWSDYKTNEEEE